MLMTKNKLLTKTGCCQIQTNASAAVNQGEHQSENKSGSNAARYRKGNEQCWINLFLFVFQPASILIFLLFILFASE